VDYIVGSIPRLAAIVNYDDFDPPINIKFIQSLTCCSCFATW
jgi:hypothetical protein